MRLRHATLLGLLLAPSSRAQTVAAQRLASGFERPSCVTSAPGDSSRVFVVDSRRGIFVVKDGVVLGEPFLDMSGVLTTNEGATYVVFHPEYATNGRFFVTYLDAVGFTHLMEYRVSADPDRADPASGVDILAPVQQPGPQHNWDCARFGPDGMLYMSTGDGNDFDVSIDNAQDLGSVLGKILRFDVDIPAPHIPPDNPFVGVQGAREEIWALGLRQPWRVSFDSATGDLYIADVGDHAREEIDFLPAASPGGANFGWRCLEGTECHVSGLCADCPTFAHEPPIHEYALGAGECAIIGGDVYRGSALPWLSGYYLFADHCSSRFWALRYDGASIVDLRELTDEITLSGGPLRPTSFGLDPAGEVLVVDLEGDVYRLVPSGSTEAYCDVLPHSAGEGARIGSSGSTSLASDDFTLECAAAVPSQFGLFFYGAQRARVPLGDGLLCIRAAAGLFRLGPPLVMDPSGGATREVDFSVPPASSGPGQIVPGSTWHFQFWFRDPLGPGGSGSNLSDGLTAVFAP